MKRVADAFFFSRERLSLALESDFSPSERRRADSLQINKIGMDVICSAINPLAGTETKACGQHKSGGEKKTETQLY